MVCGCPSLIDLPNKNLLQKKLINNSFTNIATNGCKTIATQLQEKNCVFFEQSNFNEENSNIFIDIDIWGNFLQKFDCSIGTRVHGNILAIKYGTPSIIIVSDLRTQELVEYHKIPFINNQTPICLDSIFNPDIYDIFMNNHQNTCRSFYSFLECHNIFINRLDNRR